MKGIKLPGVGSRKKNPSHMIDGLNIV